MSKTITKAHESGKLEIIYDFDLITRTVKLNGVQLAYSEYSSAPFLEWDYLNKKATI